MARKGENISHRKDGRWEGRYISGRREDGRARYASVYGHTYQEVKEKLNKCRAAQESRDGSACSLTFKLLCLQWLDCVRNTVKESTYFNYQRMIEKHILPELGHLRVDALTSNTMSRFIDSKLKHGRLDGKGGLSRKTVQCIAVIVKSVMMLAGREYNLPNRLAAVKLPKAVQPEIQVLSNNEVQRLEQNLRSEPNNSNAGLRLCLHTGIRLGEVCALRWSDIDWEYSVLHIRKTVLRLPRQDGSSGPKTRLTLTSPKTKQSEREIPLTAELSEYLRLVAQGQDMNAFILTGRPERFMDPRTYQYRFQSILKRLGIEHISFHAIRHTFATQCVRQGMDIKSLSEILGHTTVEMTLNRYVHSSLENKRRQMERLSFVA